MLPKQSADLQPITNRQPKKKNSSIKQLLPLPS